MPIGREKGTGDEDDDVGQAKKALTFEDVKLQLCAAAEKVYGVEIRPEDMPALPLVNALYSHLTGDAPSYPAGTSKTSYLAFHARLVSSTGKRAHETERGSAGSARRRRRRYRNQDGC
ncbi:hypothetical protein NFJ02_14g17780 [Pycnococcus provasolii]